MSKHAVTAAGEAMPSESILNRLKGMLEAGDAQGALSLLSGSGITQKATPLDSQPPENPEIRMIMVPTGRGGGHRRLVDTTLEDILTKYDQCPIEHIEMPRDAVIAEFRKAEAYADKLGAESSKSSRDPLLDAINAYWAGLRDFNLNAPEDDDRANEYADVSYGPPLEVLNSWEQPATTLEGALTALKITLRDENGVYGCEASEKMVLAAIGYLESLVLEGAQSTPEIAEQGVGGVINGNRKILAASKAPGVSYAPTITKIYREWERRYEIANRLGISDEEADAAIVVLSETENAMLSVKPNTMEELAMKVGVTSGFGHFPLPIEVANELIDLLRLRRE